MFAVDAIALLDALGIERPSSPASTGARGPPTSLAALWPERVRGLVSVSGYLIGSRELEPPCRCRPPPSSPGGTSSTSPPSAAERGYEQYRDEFARLIWHTASPKWEFDDETFERAAASFDNPDHVDIVIHNYRWRLGLADGEPAYDDLERRLAERPPITVPTITLEGDANGAPHPDAASYRSQFIGPYAHRVITGGVGHNLPQEAPHAFADAVIDVTAMRNGGQP